MITTPDFDPKRPEFDFDRVLETDCLKVIELITNTDKKEAIRYVKQSKGFKPFPESKKQLITNLEAYTPPSIEISEATTSPNTPLENPQ